MIIGIDNGLDGAIAGIARNRTATIYPMPTIMKKTSTGKSKRELDLYHLAYILNALRLMEGTDGVQAAVEYAQAFPGQGCVSMFSIGNGYGATRGILTALHIPFEVVRPQAWQKEFGIGKDTKGIAYQVAVNLFPEKRDEFKTPRGALLDGKVDALLIAEYYRRKTKA